MPDTKPKAPWTHDAPCSACGMPAHPPGESSISCPYLPAWCGEDDPSPLPDNHLGPVRMRRVGAEHDDDGYLVAPEYRARCFTHRPEQMENA